MQISNEVLAPLIAASGVLLSVAASLLVSKITTKIELRKLRFQAEQAYMTKVLEKRLVVYPQLYSLLSNFNKDIQYNRISSSIIKSLLTNLEAWDSDNSIFLSGYAASICYRFRKILAQLLIENDRDLEKKLSEKTFLKDLYNQVGTLELALKSDLGIFGIDVASEEDPMKKMYSLMEQGEKYGRSLDKVGIKS